MTHSTQGKNGETGGEELYKLWVRTRTFYKQRTSAYDITVRVGEVQFNTIPNAEHVT